jgi:hypothetical protein
LENCLEHFYSISFLIFFIIPVRELSINTLFILEDKPMFKDQLDAVVSRSDTEAVLSALQTIRETLPFLVALSPKDKAGLRHIGLRSQTFVTKALDVAHSHPQVVPGYLDVAAARRDLDLFVALNPILQAISELQELVEGTQTLAGSEAFTAARITYNSVKGIGDDLGLGAVVDDLSKQFRRTRRVNPATDS